MSAQKRTGTEFEVRVREYLKAKLGREVIRLAQSGTNDIGDLMIEGIPITIEVKAVKKMDLGTWMNELATEVKNRGTKLGLLFHKRRNHNVARSYCTLELGDMVELLKMAYGGDE
jgi:hypothetical protein